MPLTHAARRLADECRGAVADVVGGAGAAPESWAVAATIVCLRLGQASGGHDAGAAAVDGCSSRPSPTRRPTPVPKKNVVDGAGAAPESWAAAAMLVYSGPARAQVDDDGRE